MTQDDSVRYLRSPITSVNGLLVRDLIQSLVDEHGEIPRAYIKLLKDVGAFSSVCGYVQVTGPDALTLLKVDENKALQF